MFRKVIVFKLFEMIQNKKNKKSEDRVPGFGLWVGSGMAVRVVIKPIPLYV